MLLHKASGNVIVVFYALAQRHPDDNFVTLKVRSTCFWMLLHTGFSIVNVFFYSPAHPHPDGSFVTLNVPSPHFLMLLRKAAGNVIVVFYALTDFFLKPKMYRGHRRRFFFSLKMYQLQERFFLAGKCIGWTARFFF